MYYIYEAFYLFLWCSKILYSWRMDLFIQVQRGLSLTILVIGPSMKSEDENFKVGQGKISAQTFFGWCCGCCTFFYWFLIYVFFSCLSLRSEMFLFCRDWNSLLVSRRTILDFPGMTSDWQGEWLNGFWGSELSNVSSRRMETCSFFLIRCSGISIYITLHQWPCDVYSIFTEIPIFCCSRNVDEARVVLASIVGSGQVICKGFCTAGCTQIATSSP